MVEREKGEPENPRLEWMVDWQLRVRLLGQPPFPPERRSVPCPGSLNAPPGAAGGRGKPGSRSEWCEAGTSRAVLVQCACAAKLSARSHWRYWRIMTWINQNAFLEGQQKACFLPQNEPPLIFQFPSPNSGRGKTSSKKKLKLRK